MRTASTTNKLQPYLALSLALTLQTATAAPAEPLLSFQLEKKETICIGAGKSTSGGKCDHFISTKALTKGVRKILQRSHVLLPVFSQTSEAGDYLVFIARIPSKIPQSSGYCGAGYEDHLVLLEHSEKNIALRDDFLLQSCLKSIALDTDGGDDILKAFTFNPTKHSIEFRWLTNPDDRNHTLTILNGKFLLN